jgi:hypothetical protein
MTKHTPGPWSLKDDLIYGPDGITIVSADGLMENYGPPDRSMEENYANARLIAAAPELLEALKGLFKNNQDIDAYLQAKDKAVQAIAKAEGK